MTELLVEDVSVEFPVFTHGKQQSIRHAILAMGPGGAIARDWKNRPIVKALQHVSLRLGSGDRLALIGRNGSGKTTLLRTMAGFYSPTGGTVRARGNVSTLFNVTAGMDVELSGYENIHLMGMLLGMSRKQIDGLLPDIESFTELGPYLDMPVRTYSAGMAVRLGFAVATAISPEILLLDEALGAGDVHFIRKAFERAEQLCKQANILVVASHSSEMLSKLCNKAALLDHGRLVAFGNFDEVVSLYESGSWTLSSN